MLLLSLQILFFSQKTKSKILLIKKLPSNHLEISKIPVFCFHRLVPDDIKKHLYANNEWVGSIKIFNQMLKYIYDNKYQTISIKELYKWLIGEIKFNKKVLLITFDDGHYEDYYLVYPIIKKYNFKATSFIVGIRIKNKTAPYNPYNDSYVGLDIVNKVRKEYQNFEFQSHSFNMHFFVKNKLNKTISRINNMTNEELDDDILKNKKYGFFSMAYPYGSFNDKIIRILKNHGYLISFKFGPSNFATKDSNRFSIPRIKLNGNSNLTTLKNWLKNIK